MTLEEIGILAGVLSFVLALLIFVFDQADKKRGRRVLAGGVVLLIVGVGFAVWAPVVRDSGTPAFDNAPGPDIRPPGGRRSADSERAPRDTATPHPAPEEYREPPYKSWLRAEGALIRYAAPSGTTPGEDRPSGPAPLRAGLTGDGHWVERPRLVVDRSSSPWPFIN